MTKVLFSIIASIFTGITGHLIFFPVLERWHNLRVRRLARPAIGVTLNVIPYLVWFDLILRHRGVEDKRRRELLVCAIVGYTTSFYWHSVGVATGYMIDDWRDGTDWNIGEN